MGGKYKPYPAYKPSGVEWLRVIPADWNEVALKHIAHIRNGATPKSNEPDLWDGNIPWLTPADIGKGNSPYISYGKRNISYKGLNSCGATLVPADSIILSCRAPIGTLGISLSFVSTNQGCKSLIPKFMKSEKYLYYFLSSAVGSLNMLGRGSTFLELSSSDLGSFKIAVPSLMEQIQIAAFLDHETAKIDALIAKQQRLIELLEEKRQAVISHAVTKGLNPNAPMRPSGIDWLGDVPEHWEILSLNRIIDQFVDYRGKTPTKIEEGVPLITATQIKRGVIDHDLDPVYISTQEYRERMTRGFPSKGDLLLTTEAPLGEVALIEDERVATGQRIILMKCDHKYVVSQFLLHHFQSDFGKSELHIRSSGSTASGIRADRLRASKVNIPAISEQIEIVDYIDNKLSKFQILENKARLVIALLKERRIALISAAVTGKIDVRDWQPQKSNSGQKFEARETVGA